jgi:hypothetical protein
MKSIVTSQNARSVSASSMTDHIQWGDHLNNTIKKYSIIADAINPDKNVDDSSTTHPYKESAQRKYYGMVESLWNSGLLKEDMKVMDLGCGLCTTLYNLNLQFKNYEIRADFYGIDHNEELLKLTTKHLSQFWVDNKLSIGLNGIMDFDSSDYDLILSYQPFKDDYVGKMYDKIFREMKTGSIFYEHSGFSSCREVLMESSSENNMKERVLLFGGEKQTLFLKN